MSPVRFLESRGEFGHQNKSIRKLISKLISLKISRICSICSLAEIRSFHYHASKDIERNWKVSCLATESTTGATWLKTLGAGAEAWFFLSKSNARTISLSSATSGETTWVEEFALTLATTALARV
ncbi:hypothetical protein Tco_0246228 [Tanacetum coccineum]